LKDQGYNLVVLWECKWERLKREDKKLGDLVRSMKLAKPLDPRDAFFGGRTETFKLWSDKGPILYHDVTSLYPWVNSTMRYPVGHPEIILSDFKDISEYFGIIKCTVVPPRDLYIPVLPMHAGPTKKLLFSLCRSCAESFEEGKCEHSDEERAIQGTWFSEEVKLAVEKGYKITAIHSVWHFAETTTDLFAAYIRTFYEKKLLSSKLPYTTEEEILAFMREVKEREKIDIFSPDLFKENPGLRQITKLMLNNLWGRFGMSENFSKCQFVTKFEDLEKIFEDSTREVQSVRVINEKVSQVVTRAAEKDFLECSRDTNIFIALTTTAWARMRLYSELNKLDRRVLYCDTDSVIYEASPNPAENLTTGSFLGDMTSELPEGDHIVEFVSGGPKNYAYVTLKGKTEVKVKGFTQNATNAPALAFVKIKKVTLNGVGAPPTPKRKRVLRAEFLDEHLEICGDEPSAIPGDHGISTYNPLRIFRTKDWRVVQRAEQKLYSFHFDKRVIERNTYDTFPYGFMK
jgi:hypothetical protein